MWTENIYLNFEAALKIWKEWDSTTTKNCVFNVTPSDKEWWINKLSYFPLTKELENNANSVALQLHVFGKENLLWQNSC